MSSLFLFLFIILVLRAEFGATRICNCVDNRQLFNNERGDHGEGNEYLIQSEPHGVQFNKRKRGDSRRNEIKTPLKCSFISSTQSLICISSIGERKSVNCDASNVVESRGNSFKLFSISSIGVGKSFQVKFSLYPQNIIKTSFLDTEFYDQTLNRTMQYSIYFSSQYADYGIRVMKATCWKKLIDMFTEMAIYAKFSSVVKKTGETVRVSSVATLLFD